MKKKGNNRPPLVSWYLDINSQNFGRINNSVSNIFTIWKTEYCFEST